jgi:hypothetical protein
MRSLDDIGGYIRDLGIMLCRPVLGNLDMSLIFIVISRGFRGKEGGAH